MTFAIIDPNTIFRTGLYTILSKNFPDAFFVTSNSIESFQQQDNAVQPDLIFCSEPQHIDATTKILQLKNDFKQTAIVIYDVVFDLNLIRKYLKIGIVGCMPRLESEFELLQCVNEVIENKRFIGLDFQQMILKEMVYKPDKFKNKSTKSLSLREREIATYLSQGYKTSWIATRLGRKQTTISTTKKNIFNKLNVSNTVEMRQILSHDPY